MWDNLMIDIETMGVKDDAPLVSLGARPFNLQTYETGPSFFSDVWLEDAVQNGGVLDASTVLFWMDQVEKSGYAPSFVHSRTKLARALDNFTEYCKGTMNPGFKMWAKGPQFDCNILRRSYKSVDRKEPWGFRNERCVRTFLDLFPPGDVERGALVAHNALDDVDFQIQQLFRGAEFVWSLTMQ